MNRTKIEYVDYTWNPITGCLNNCSYCYARRMAKRWGGKNFLPEFHADRLDEPAKLKKPSRIFVCSMAEMFGDWISNDWIAEILDVVEMNPQHTFLLLTKNPERMSGWSFPPNVWAGKTITNQWDCDCQIDYFPLECKVNYVSFEPLLGPIDLTYVVGGIDWVIIGSMTGPGAVKPDIKWIVGIKDWAGEHNIPVFIKDNCGWGSLYQKFPKEELSTSEERASAGHIELKSEAKET